MKEYIVHIVVKDQIPRLSDTYLDSLGTFSSWVTALYRKAKGLAGEGEMAPYEEFRENTVQSILRQDEYPAIFYAYCEDTVLIVINRSHGYWGEGTDFSDSGQLIQLHLEDTPNATNSVH